MATGFPATTGDVLSANMFNGLVTFTVNPQSGATYTIANVDVYQALVQLTNASTKVVTIAPDSTLTAAATGTAITFLNTGAGLLTFAAGAGVTIRSDGAKLTLNAQYACATLLKIASDTWVAVGNLKA